MVREHGTWTKTKEIRSFHRQWRYGLGAKVAAEFFFPLTQGKFSEVIECDYDTDDVVADLLGLQKTQWLR